MRIDSHQHFWHFDPARDTWPPAAMAPIQRDFLPADLAPLLAQHNFDGCVVVQKDQSTLDNDLQLQHAATHDFIKGIVGWVDLRADDLRSQLDHYQQFPKIKGFRHVLESERDRALMLRQSFMRGIKALGEYGYTYDLLIRPDQLAYATILVSSLPNQVFVLDHLAKPLITKSGQFGMWRRDIHTLAGCGNVYCKVSGLVTETDWDRWKPADFRPCLDVVFQAFGPRRVIYGSDWPVCNLAGGYARALALVEDYLRPFSTTEQQLFWGENAVRVYGL